MVKYRREMGRRVRPIESETKFTRNTFLTIQVRDQEGERLLKQRLENRFLVKGRVTAGKVLWDVFQLSGRADPVLIAGGFIWQEEAIAFARDRKLGRNSVSFGGMRAVFGKAKSGSIISPTRNIELPGKQNVRVKPTSKGVVVG